MTLSSRKITLITGATSGIGLACANIFAKNNYDLIITGRRKERLEKIAAELTQKYHINILSLCFDVRKKSEVESNLAHLPDRWNKIDILINNAGLAAGLAPIQNGDIQDWETMIDTNIKGLLYVSSCIIPYMINHKKGMIINLGSIAGKEVYAKGNVYCASKHAVDAITKSMRIDLLEHGIKVSSVCPGAVETEFSWVRFKGNQEKVNETYKGFTPLKADDVAETIYWISTRPAHVNINDIILMPAAQANTSHTYKV